MLGIAPGPLRARFPPVHRLAGELTMYARIAAVVVVALGAGQALAQSSTVVVPPPAPIPEVSGALVMGVGMAVIGYSAWRQRKK